MAWGDKMALLTIAAAVVVGAVLGLIVGGIREVWLWTTARSTTSTPT